MLNIGLIVTSAGAIRQELPAWKGLLFEFDSLDFGRFDDAIICYLFGKV